MSKFRAINQPSETPSSPSSGELPQFDTVFPELGQASRDQPLSRSFAVVIPPTTQTRGQSTSKGSLEEAVTKARKTSEMPRKKNKRKKQSNLQVSKPQRLQAPREKKLVHSIEYTPRNTGESPTPQCITDGAGSDYDPSIGLPETSPSSASITPARHGPREHGSRSAIAGSRAVLEPSLTSSPSQVSSEDGAAFALIKRESSAVLQAAPTWRQRSPLIWNKEARRRRYDEAEFVELPKEVFEYHKIKKELAMKKLAMLTGKRMEKGKGAEQSLVEEPSESTSKTRKRKTEGQADEEKPRKRHKSKKHKTEDRSITKDGGGKKLAETDQRRSRQKSSEDKIAKEPQTSQALHESKHQQRSHQDRAWREPYSRREVDDPESSRHPRRSDNDSSESIFQFAQGVLSTRDPNKSNMGREQSSIPPPVFYGNEARNRPPTNAGSSAEFCVPKLKSTQQSQAANPESAQPEKERVSGRPSSNALPTRDKVKDTTVHAPSHGPYRPSHHAAIDPISYLTSPNSFPLGKRSGPAIPNPLDPSTSATSGPAVPRDLNTSANAGSGPAVPSNLTTPANAPSENSNLTTRQISKPPPQHTSGVKPKSSFKSRRRRYQSVPTTIYSKRPSNDQTPVPSSTPRGIDNTLREIHNNAIVTRLESLEKTVKDRLPTPTQPTTTTKPPDTTTIKHTGHCDPARHSSASSHGHNNSGSKPLQSNLPKAAEKKNHSTAKTHPSRTRPKRTPTPVQI